MDNTENIVESLVEVTLKDPQDFLKVRETLTRIGVSSRIGNKLYQSCHILHKRGKYYITHFKELFALDGLPSKMSEEDFGRRNTIVGLLAEWGLIDIVDDANVLIQWLPSKESRSSHIRIVKSGNLSLNTTLARSHQRMKNETTQQKVVL